MRSALLSLVALAGSSAAAGQYVLSEELTPDNLMDNFDYFESDHTTGDYLDVDPAGGFVNYVKGPTKFSGKRDGYFSLGVDTTSVLPGDGHAGRSSARLESKKTYKHGLIVARFAQFPKAQCGVWPAFWTVGAAWPNEGEVDLYEQWNDATTSGPVFHVGDSSKYGQCIMDGEGQTAQVYTDNCDNFFSNEPHQYQYQGCASKDAVAPWANPNGGVYAMEWTSDFLKVFSWTHDTVPADVASSSPDPSTWGTPSAFLKNDKCDIDRHFGPQQMVLNIDFCGAPAGTESEWAKSCKAATGYDTCVEFVAKEPKAFEGVEFKIQDIRYFVVGEGEGEGAGGDDKESPKKPTDDPDKVQEPQVPTHIIEPPPPQSTEEPVILTSTTALPSPARTETGEPAVTPSPDVSTDPQPDLPPPSEALESSDTTIHHTKTVIDCPPYMADCPGLPTEPTHVPEVPEPPVETSGTALPTEQATTLTTRVVVTKVTSICSTDESGTPIMSETPTESHNVPHETPVVPVKPTPKTTLTPKVPATSATETPTKPKVTSFLICPPGVEDCSAESSTLTPTPTPTPRPTVTPTPEEPFPEETPISPCFGCEVPTFSTSLALPGITPVPGGDCVGGDCPPVPTPVPVAGGSLLRANVGLALGAAVLGGLLLV